MAKFKVGDVVHMSEVGMANWSNTKTNPHYGKGTITDITISGYFIKVEWANGQTNTYTPSELAKGKGTPPATQWAVRYKEDGVVKYDACNDLATRFHARQAAANTYYKQHHGVAVKVHITEVK